ncbi:hypothetical protein ABBQ32_012566 [Trebouxia sp. C0010 RCD-2024]
MHRNSRDFLEALAHVPEEQRTWKRLLVTPALQDKPSDAQKHTNGAEQVISQGTGKETAKSAELVDLRDLNRQQRQQIVDNALATNEQSNELLLQKYAERAERVGIELPTTIIKFKKLSVSSQISVGSRSLPTLPNSVLNFGEGLLTALRLMKSSKQKFAILKDLSGIIQPGRLTLLMGPPGGGKSTLLQLLAGLLGGHSVQVSGEVTYNGQPLSSFLPQRTAAYVPQEDAHIAKLTVQETLDFSARCQGTASIKPC